MALATCASSQATPPPRLRPPPQDAPVSGQGVDDDQGDDGDDGRRQEQTGQRRQYRGGGRRNLVEQPEQALIPPECSGFEQDRHNTEQRCSEARQKSGRPGRGIRAGRFGHHHDSSDFIEPDPDRACSGRPRWLTADAVRKPAATIGLKLAFDIARGPPCCAEYRLRCRLVPRQAGPMSFEGLSGLVNRIFAWADRLQRKHGVLGFPYAVVKSTATMTAGVRRRSSPTTAS